MLLDQSSHEGPRMSHDPPKPPEHLQPATQSWWRAIVAKFELEPHQLHTLQAAAESWDRKEQARQALAQHGLSYVDAKGMVRALPEAAIERDSRTAYLRAMRELDLKIEPPGRDWHRPWLPEDRG